MAKRALLALTLGAVFGAVPTAFAQAVAESAIMHGGSAMSAGIARKLGGSINQSLSTSQQSLSGKSGMWESGRRGTATRTRRTRARTASATGAPISISSVQGSGAPCAAVEQKAAPAQGQATTASSRDCFSKVPASEIRKTGKSEVTVSFK
jgi:hypothetical protein